MNAKKFDVGIMLYSTDFSYRDSKDFAQVALGHVRRLKNLADEPIVVTIDSEDYSQEIGVKHVPLGITFTKYVKHLSFLSKSFTKINQLLKQNKGKSVVLIGRNLLAGSVVSLLGKKHSVPSVVYFHYDWAMWKKYEKQWVDFAVAKMAEKTCIKFADLIIATAPFLKDRLVKRGRKPEEIEVAPNHVNTSDFCKLDKKACRKRLNMPEGEKNLFFAGRLVFQKNIFTLITALSQVQGVKAYIAGTGELEKKLKEFALEKQVAGRIWFLGIIPQKKIVEYLNACDVFVLPSFYEGSPKILIESMACGCAIIASSGEGNEGVIEDGRNGLLFNPHDAEELAAKISGMTQDTQFAAKMAEQAGRDSREYSIETVMELEQEIFAKHFLGKMGKK